MKDRFKSLRDRVRLMSGFGRVTIRATVVAYLALARVAARERLWAVPARGDAR